MYELDVDAVWTHSDCLFVQKEHVKIAQQYFQLVGGSASECGKLHQLTGFTADVLVARCLGWLLSSQWTLTVH